MPADGWARSCSRHRRQVVEVAGAELRVEQVLTGLPGAMLPSAAPETCSSEARGRSRAAVCSVKPSSGCSCAELEAADRDPAPRPLGVRRVEERHAVLGRPGEPVEEALLARALLGDAHAGEALGAAGVVGADVEEAVELVERLASGREPPWRPAPSPPAGRPSTDGRRGRTGGSGRAGSGSVSREEGPHRGVGRRRGGGSAGAGRRASAAARGANPPTSSSVRADCAQRARQLAPWPWRCPRSSPASAPNTLLDALTRRRSSSGRAGRARPSSRL